MDDYMGNTGNANLALSGLGLQVESVNVSTVSPSDGLPVWAIILIIVGSIIGAGFLIAIPFVFCKKDGVTMQKQGSKQLSEYTGAGAGNDMPSRGGYPECK